MTYTYQRKTPLFKRRKPSLKHLKLVQAYFDCNFVKKEAAIRAGYSPTHTDRLFSHPDVVREIERRRGKLEARLDLTREWIVSRLMKLADSNITLAKYKKVDEDGAPYWDFTGASQEDMALLMEISQEGYIQGLGEGGKKIRKFKVAPGDPMAALMALARIQGLFDQNINVKGEIDIISRIQKGRERAAKEAEAPSPDDDE